MNNSKTTMSCNDWLEATLERLNSHMILLTHVNDGDLKELLMHDIRCIKDTVIRAQRANDRETKK